MLFNAQLLWPFGVRSKTGVKNKRNLHYVEDGGVNQGKLAERS